MSFTSPKNEKEINIDIENLIHSNNINNVSESEKKLNFFEMNLKFRNKINIDYTDYDLQKGEHSPKFLFRKRKFENFDNSKQANTIKESDKQNANSISNKNTNNISEETSIIKFLNFLCPKFF
jgi:hypothetical protein